MFGQAVADRPYDLGQQGTAVTVMGARRGSLVNAHNGSNVSVCCPARTAGEQLELENAPRSGRVALEIAELEAREAGVVRAGRRTFPN